MDQIYHFEKKVFGVHSQFIGWYLMGCPPWYNIIRYGP